MCGISGIYSTKYNLKQKLVEFNVALKHRGPDENFIYLDDSNYFGMAHTRLSIIDITEKGRQPMKHNNLIISYNGEIYNHMDIRYLLNKQVGKKIHWNGTSDTETILKTMDILGIKKTLELLEGMFVFAIYDEVNKNLYLARDRMGEKPLYFYFKNNNFIFGSELSIFKKLNNLNLNINKNSVYSFLQKGYISSPESIFEDVNKLKPGTLLTVSNNFKKITEHNFWSIKDNVNLKSKKNITKSYSVLKKETQILLENKIESAMISDVEIGSFLSGGVDSSLITSIMQKHSKKKIKTFTVKFENKNFDESPRAKLISKHLGTSHFEYIASDKDILDMVSNIHNIYEEPLADSSQIPTFLISKLMKNNVKVILSGDGGDELFGGYNRYIYFNKIRNISKLTPNFLKNILYKFSQNNSLEFLNKYFLDQKGEKILKLINFISSKNEFDLYNKFTLINENLLELIASSKHIVKTKNFDTPKFDNFIEKMMYLDQSTYLPDDIMCKVDRATMSNSIESRSPLLNHKIVEHSWSIPIKYKVKNGKGKFILRDILNNYLPENMIEKSKKGFAIPIGELLRTSLKNWGNEIIYSSNYHDQFININFLKKLWSRHQKRKINIGEKLWIILNFQNWIINQKYN